MSGCIFCEIIKKEAPADIIYEDNQFIVFKNIRPLASIHILIVPKKHIVSVEYIGREDKELIGELFLTVRKIARNLKISKSGYKLVFNVGKGGGQMISHLHLHLLAGWRGKEERDVPGMP